MQGDHSPRLAVYPGSFDPLTNGHVDIIQRGARLFDRIVIALLVNPDKSALFSVAERAEMAREVFVSQPAVEVDTFDGCSSTTPAAAARTSSSAACGRSRTSSTRCRWRS